MTPIRRNNQDKMKILHFKDVPRHGMNSAIRLHTSSVAIRAKYRERFSNDCPSNYNSSKRRDRNSCQFPLNLRWKNRVCKMRLVLALTLIYRKIGARFLARRSNRNRVTTFDSHTRRALCITHFLDSESVERR